MIEVLEVYPPSPGFMAEAFRKARGAESDSGVCSFEWPGDESGLCEACPWMDYDPEGCLGSFTEGPVFVLGAKDKSWVESQWPDGGGLLPLLGSIQAALKVRAPRGWWAEAARYAHLPAVGPGIMESEATGRAYGRADLSRGDMDRIFGEGRAELIAALLTDASQKCAQVGSPAAWRAFRDSLPEGLMQTAVLSSSYLGFKRMMDERGGSWRPEWLSLLFRVFDALPCAPELIAGTLDLGECAFGGDDEAAALFWEPPCGFDGEGVWHG